MHLASFGDAGHYSIRCLLRADLSPSKQGCLSAIRSNDVLSPKRGDEKRGRKKKEGKEENREVREEARRRIVPLVRMFQVIDESRRRSGVEFGMPYAIDRFVVNPKRV